MTHKIGFLVSLLGAVGSMYAGWYIVRGPFFGYPLPPVEYILVASGVFVVMMYLFAWGIEANYRSFGGGDRPDIDEKQNQTMDMPFGPR